MTHSVLRTFCGRHSRHPLEPHYRNGSPFAIATVLLRIFVPKILAHSERIQRSPGCPAIRFAPCTLYPTFQRIFLRIFLSNCFTKSYKNISKIHPKWVNIYPLLWENMWEISLQNIIKILCEEFTKITYKNVRETCERMWEISLQNIHLHVWDCERHLHLYPLHIVRECEGMWEKFLRKIYRFVSSNFTPILYKLSIYLCERLCEHFLQIFLTTCKRMWENKLTIFSLQIVRECESISYKFSIQICAIMCEIFKKKIIKIIHKNHKVYRSIFPIFSKKSDKKHNTIP